MVVVSVIAMYYIYDFSERSWSLISEYFWPSPQVASISVEMPGIKVSVGETDSWEVVLKLLVTLLGSYAGIKTINKIFK